MLSEVTAAECRAYVKSRGKTGGARADLETLRAAINHHAKENLHYGLVRVTLPPKGPPRDRWLTRDEAAKLIWACWRYRETADRASWPPQGTADRDRQAAASALGSLHSDWPLHRHARRRDRLSLAVPQGRPFVRRPRSRHLLSARDRPPRDQQAADAGADTAAAAGSYAALGSPRHCHVSFRGMAGRAGQVGQDRLQTCRRAGRSVGQGHAAHAAAHGGDLADAARRANLAGRRLSSACRPR